MVSTDVEARELARLKKLMKNPSYWRDRDPAIVKAVTKGFEDLYDSPKQSESEASKLKDLPEARQGQMANILGLNGLTNKRDTYIAHLTPGEIVLPLSAQTEEVMALISQTLGEDLPIYTVGSGKEQINPESGLPAFADYNNYIRNRAENLFNESIDDIENGLVDAQKAPTRWHYEDREKLNRPLPNSPAQAKTWGFKKYSQGESIYHQDKKGKPEDKYGHPDGREVVFNGDTGKKITDPSIKGTYNYVYYPPYTEDVGAVERTARFFGHLGTDVIPYELWGTPRRK